MAFDFDLVLDFALRIQQPRWPRLSGPPAWRCMVADQPTVEAGCRNERRSRPGGLAAGAAGQGWSTRCRPLFRRCKDAPSKQPAAMYGLSVQDGLKAQCRGVLPFGCLFVGQATKSNPAALRTECFFFAMLQETTHGSTCSPRAVSKNEIAQNSRLRPAHRQ